ncbi:MAG: tRNA pseudouridine(55) synthase TruB, partial [Proteobacteria bacterium]|nr:tRNA pseudouridine(55) synthase TruB [Pseudomonadota bacterium]
EQVRFTHGNPAPVREAQPGKVRVFGRDGEILGLGEVREDRKVYPQRLFIL